MLPVSVQAAQHRRTPIPPTSTASLRTGGNKIVGRALDKQSGKIMQFTATGWRALALALSLSALLVITVRGAAPVSTGGTRVAVDEESGTYEAAATTGGGHFQSPSGFERLKIGDVEFDQVIIGCWMLTEAGYGKDISAMSVDDAVETLVKFADAGFRTFDTADIYGPSERILGKVLERWSSSGRLQVHGPLTVFTKSVPRQLTSATAQRTVQNSMRSLRLPALDLVQMHTWDYEQGTHAEVAAALAAMPEVRNMGLTNFDTEHLREVVMAGAPVRTMQVQLSLLDRRPLRPGGVAELCRSQGIKLLVFGTVAGGWLSDRWVGVSEEPQDDDTWTTSMRMYRRSMADWGSWALFQELLSVLRRVADRHSVTVANVAARWALESLGPGGGAIIVGVRNVAHLDETRGIGTLRLEAGDMREIQAVLDKGMPPKGDCWDRERSFVR